MGACLADSFVRAVGHRLAHVTAAANVRSIRATGLKPAATLAQEAGLATGALGLRGDRLAVGPALLNHQRPILRGMAAARAMLEGHDPASWAAQLDTRVFLWPAARGQRFAASIARDVPIAILWLDATTLAEAMADRIDLCPINSENFTQGGANAARGDWIYTPLTAGLETFRTARQCRGLVKAPDQVREVSLRAAIPAEVMRAAEVTHA